MGIGGCIWVRAVAALHRRCAFLVAGVRGGVVLLHFRLLACASALPLLHVRFALRLCRRCCCCDVASAACDSSSERGLGLSLPFGCTNSIEASWMVSVDWSSSSMVVVFSCS